MSGNLEGNGVDHEGNIFFPFGKPEEADPVNHQRIPDETTEYNPDISDPWLEARRQPVPVSNFVYKRTPSLLHNKSVARVLACLAIAATSFLQTSTVSTNPYDKLRNFLSGTFNYSQLQGPATKVNGEIEVFYHSRADFLAAWRVSPELPFSVGLQRQSGGYLQIAKAHSLFYENAIGIIVNGKTDLCVYPTAEKEEAYAKLADGFEYNQPVNKAVLGPLVQGASFDCSFGFAKSPGS